MQDLKSNKYIYRSAIISIIIWTIAILLAEYWNSRTQKEITSQIVTNVAKAEFNKNMAYRKWISEHGGIYIEPSEKTPPNPHLKHVKDRDIVSTSGKKLTLMNSSYVLRDMMNDYSKEYGVKGKISSIRALNPDNQANIWERNAIEEFKSGVDEKIEITGTHKNEYLRFMKPMKMRQSCQKCHGHLGFKNGSILGGLSISIPMYEYRQKELQAVNTIRYTALIIWLLGLISILVIMKLILDNHKQKQKDIDELIISHKVLDNMQDLMFITDINGKILRINNAFTEVTGYSENDVLGKTPNILNSGQHDNEFYHLLWLNLNKYGKFTAEMVNRKKDGNIFVCIENITSVKDIDGKIKYFIAILHDITIRKDTENKTIHMAHYDALTDLPNRVLFELRFEHALQFAKRNNKKIALAYLDIDGFKNVNDTLGHTIGDKLLKNIASKLRSCVRESDTIARLGGDEFCIIFENLDDQYGIITPLKKILKLISEDITIDGNEIKISASIGVSLYPNDGQKIEILVECADIAMYECKNNGKNNFCFYNKAN